MYTLGGNRWKFINFVQIGEYAICIIGLGFRASDSHFGVTYLRAL